MTAGKTASYSTRESYWLNQLQVTEMKTEEMVNKENEVMTTKDGAVMFKHTLEAGDKFVCLWNKPVAEKKGDAKFETYKMKANVLVGEKVEEVFLTLTPTQYNSLLNIVNDKESDDLNQYKFTAYEYTSKTYGDGQVGITHKEKKEPVSLLD